MADNVQIPHFKPNSVVPVSLNLANINGLYTIYDYLTSTLGKDGAIALKAKIETKQPLNKLEMSVLSISTILHIVHESGKANDLVEMHSLTDDIVSAVTSQG